MRLRPLLLALLVAAWVHPVGAVGRAGPWTLVVQDCEGDWPATPASPHLVDDAYDLVAVYAADRVVDGLGMLSLALVMRDLEGRNSPFAALENTLWLDATLERGGVQTIITSEYATADSMHFAHASGEAAAIEVLSPWNGPLPWTDSRPHIAFVLSYPYASFGMDGQSVVSTVDVRQNNNAAVWRSPGPSQVDARGDFIQAEGPCNNADNKVTSAKSEPAVPYPLHPLPPLVHASANRTMARSGEPIRFQGAVTPGGGEVEGVEWDFGDGTQAANLNATHAFFQRGTYRVNFTAREHSDFFGRFVQASLDVTILNAPPRALASGPSQLRVGTNATFRDHSTDLDGAIASRRWEFPDGGVSTQRNATHTFLRAGTFPVRLTVTDDAGANATKALSVLVVQDLPVARFTAPGSATVGRTVNATDLSTDPDGQLVAWKWTLDGQDVASTRNLTFAMPSAGAHTLCLKVTDDQGAIDHVCRLVTGIAQQTAAAATATGNQTSQSSGQGVSSSQSSSSQGGSQSGQAASTAGTLPAAPHPSIRILAPTVFAPGKPVQFLAESEGTILSWRWEFGDGGNSTARSPQHSYAEPGAYQVIATAKTAGGAQLQATAGILIQEVAVAPAAVAARAAPLAWLAPLVGMAVAVALVACRRPD